jgi:SAM-dependent methyltransferase
MKLLNLGCGRRYHSDWVNVDFRSTGPGVIAHDLNRPLPFPTGAFDAVYHSHLLEHLPKKYAPLFLKECFRLLKKGGVLRVVVPDLEQIVRLYLALLEKALQGDIRAQTRYNWILIELFDQMVRNKPGGDMLTYWKQNPMPGEDFVIERLGSEVLNFLKEIRSNPNKDSFELDNPDPSALQIGQFRLAGEVHLWMYDRYSLTKLLETAGFQSIQSCQANESAIPGFKAYRLDVENDGSVRKPDSLFMEAHRLR